MGFFKRLRKGKKNKQKEPDFPLESVYVNPALDTTSVLSDPSLDMHRTRRRTSPSDPPGRKQLGPRARPPRDDLRDIDEVPPPIRMRRKMNSSSFQGSPTREGHVEIVNINGELAVSPSPMRPRKQGAHYSSDLLSRTTSLNARKDGCVEVRGPAALTGAAGPSWKVTTSPPREPAKQNAPEEEGDLYSNPIEEEVVSLPSGNSHEPQVLFRISSSSDFNSALNLSPRLPQAEAGPLSSPESPGKETGAESLRGTTEATTSKSVSESLNTEVQPFTAQAVAPPVDRALVSPSPSSTSKVDSLAPSPSKSLDPLTDRSTSESLASTIEQISDDDVSEDNGPSDEESVLEDSFRIETFPSDTGETDVEIVMTSGEQESNVPAYSMEGGEEELANEEEKEEEEEEEGSVEVEGLLNTTIISVEENEENRKREVKFEEQQNEPESIKLATEGITVTQVFTAVEADQNQQKDEASLPENEQQCMEEAMALASEASEQEVVGESISKSVTAVVHDETSTDHLDEDTTFLFDDKSSVGDQAALPQNKEPSSPRQNRSRVTFLSQAGAATGLSDAESCSSSSIEQSENDSGALNTSGMSSMTPPPQRRSRRQTSKKPSSRNATDDDSLATTGTEQTLGTKMGDAEDGEQTFVQELGDMMQEIKEEGPGVVMQWLR